jgi:hypothetical protein
MNQSSHTFLINMADDCNGSLRHIKSTSVSRLFWRDKNKQYIKCKKLPAKLKKYMPSNQTLPVGKTISSQMFYKLFEVSPGCLAPHVCWEY